MRNITLALALLLAVFGFAYPTLQAEEKKEEAKENLETKGFTPGKMTHDFEAAKKYAAEKKLPMLLVFTGSDWCYWCKVMEKNVLNKKEWANYSKDNLVVVWLDFPKNKKLVPEEYVERNQKMKEQFPVRGFPTYVLTKSDGKSVIGTLGAGQDKTPASFQEEIKELLKMTDEAVETFCKKYPKHAEAYKKHFAEYKAAESKRKHVDMEKANDNMFFIRIKAKLKKDQITDFETAKKEYLAAKDAIQAFYDTKPQRNEENNKKHEALKAAIATAKAKLEAF